MLVVRHYSDDVADEGWVVLQNLAIHENDPNSTQLSLPAFDANRSDNRGIMQECPNDRNTWSQLKVKTDFLDALARMAYTRRLHLSSTHPSLTTS